MKTYLVDIEDRHGDNGTLGPFRTKKSALAAMKKYVEKHYRAESIPDLFEEFGGSFESGEFFSEDEVITVIERDLQD